MIFPSRNHGRFPAEKGTLNMTRSTQNLLRRTFATCFVLAVAFSTSAFAQSFNCSFPSITPSGSFTINCTPPASAPPSGQTAGGQFTLSGATSLTVGSASSYSVTRSGSSLAGAYNASVTVSPANICSGGGSFSFGDGATAGSGSASVTPLAQGTCTITLNLSSPTGTAPNVAATTSGSPINATVSPVVVSGPPPSSGSGCPTGFVLPSNYADAAVTVYPSYTNDGSPNHLLRVASGVVSGFPLPKVNPGHNSGSMWITENVVSPASAISIDVMISPCKGYIPSDAAGIATAGACYLHSGNGSYNEIKWAGKDSAGYGAAFLNSAGFCPALESSGTYYVNIRFGYSACNYGTCGEVLTFYDSYY